MKTIGLSIVSFILGLLVAGAIGYKTVMFVTHQALVSKLTDNVMFYRQIEKGKSELTQSAIASSLGTFINLTQNIDNSIWTSASDSDRRALVEAIELHSQLQEKQNSQ